MADLHDDYWFPEPVNKKIPSAVKASARESVIDTLSVNIPDVNTNVAIPQGLGELPEGWAEATPKQQDDLIELMRLVMSHGSLPGLYLETIPSEAPENGFAILAEFRGVQNRILIFGWRPKIKFDLVEMELTLQEIFTDEDARRNLIEDAKEAWFFRQAYNRAANIKSLRETLLEEQQVFKTHMNEIQNRFEDPRNWCGTLSRSAVILIGPARDRRRRT